VPRPLSRLPLFLAVLCLASFASLAKAADRDRLEAFLQVTGFDVALESIKLSASTAPEMIGLESKDFGSQWTRLADEVFDVDVMHGLAMDLLEETLSDDMLNHGVEFYASDLGQRLVEAENTSHMIEDDAAKRAQGLSIVAELVSEGDPRVELLKAMNRAVDSTDASVRSIQEIQVRFLMAAAGAGVVELRMDEPDLRAFLKSQEGELRASLIEGGLAASAFTYRDFSDDDIIAYTAALEHPLMSELYGLMNAVQYEIMANRFEALATEMADLQPAQEL